jgi:hypothetical protein
MESELDRCETKAPEAEMHELAPAFTDLWNAIIRLTARVAELEMRK